MPALSFSSKLVWDSYIVSMTRNASRKIEALICCVKFLSAKGTFYLFKSTIQLCMKYCCHVWACAPSCYLDMLHRLQKWVCRAVGPTLSVSVEPVGHQRHLANLSLL